MLIHNGIVLRINYTGQQPIIIENLTLWQELSYCSIAWNFTEPFVVHGPFSMSQTKPLFDIGISNQSFFVDSIDALLAIRSEGVISFERFDVPFNFGILTKYDTWLNGSEYDTSVLVQVSPAFTPFLIICTIFFFCYRRKYRD